MTEQHLHYYHTGGRCISSVLLPAAAPVAQGGKTVPARIQWHMLGTGGCLELWHEDEQAGLASWGDGTIIVRIKPVGLMRDMQAAGARAIVETIRKDGVEVEPITGSLKI